MRVPVGTLVVVACVVMVAPSAFAQSDAGHRVPGTNVTGCDVQVRPNGTTVRSWMSRTGSAPPFLERAYVAEKPAGGGWSRPQVVFAHRVGLRGRTTSSGVYGYCPEIVLGKGRALDVVWDQHRETVRPNSNFVESGPHSLLVRSRRPGGRWSATRKVAASDGFVQATSSGMGQAVVIFGGRRGEQTISRRSDGTWTRPRFLDSTGSANTRYHVVFDARGDAVIAWHNRRTRTTSIKRSRGVGRWGSNEPVPGENLGDCRSEVSSLAADGRGAVAMTWECGNAAVRVASQDASGRWSPIAEFDRAPERRDESGRPVQPTIEHPLGVQFDGAGAAHVAWITTTPAGTGADTEALRTTSRPAASEAWDPPTTAVANLPLEQVVGSAFGLAADGRGAAIIEDARFNEDGDRELARLLRIRRRADGSWGALEQIDGFAGGSFRWQSALSGSVLALLWSRGERAAPVRSVTTPLP